MANTVDRKRVVRVHITQDDFGYWMMSLECDDGTLMLASYRFEHPEHEIQHAFHPEKIGLPPDTEFLISEPSVSLQAGTAAWTKPQPRRARLPYYVVKNGKRLN